MCAASTPEKLSKTEGADGDNDGSTGVGRLLIFKIEAIYHVEVSNVAVCLFGLFPTINTFTSLQHNMNSCSLHCHRQFHPSEASDSEVA